MRITKRQLRRIIKEEKLKLSEQPVSLDPFADKSQLDALSTAIGIVEDHIKKMPDPTPDLGEAIKILNKLWEDLDDLRLGDL